MSSLASIVRFLDRILNIYELPEASNNGLQVGKDEKIFKIGFAVDACMEVFENAKSSGANLIIVHHGISWGDSLKYVTSLNYKRLKFLLDNRISLYCAHLPLDKHPDYGNNVQLFRLLKLKNTRPFGLTGGDYIGYSGEFDSEKTFDEVIAIVEEKLNTKCRVLKFGKSRIRTAAIMSGAGAVGLPEAVEKGIDVLITGEIKHSSYHTAKDGRINVIAAGHYATETAGLKALMRVIEQKFNIPTVFLESDTGM